MAEHYRFFGGTPEDPRQYNQTEFAEVFERFFKNGIFPNVGSELKVEPTDPARMAVRVATGQAWINGYWYKNDDWKEIDLPPADPDYPRIHRIVLRLDTVNERRILATVKVGTPQSNPVVPELERTDQIWEISLATVYVAAGATSVTEHDITDDRYSDTCCGVAVPRDVTTQAEFDTHTSDNVRHITAEERASWNSKETPAGAQAKADAAEQAAKTYVDDKPWQRYALTGTDGTGKGGFYSGDMDDLIDTGVYSISNATNRPVALTGTVFVSRRSGDHVSQLWLTISGGIANQKIFYRSSVDSGASWSPWTELITSNGGTITSSLSLQRQFPNLELRNLDNYAMFIINMGSYFGVRIGGSSTANDVFRVYPDRLDFLGGDVFHAGYRDSGSKIITLLESLSPPFHTTNTSTGSAQGTKSYPGGDITENFDMAKFAWDNRLSAGGRSVYFEANIRNSSSGNTTYAALKRVSNNQLIGQISTTGAAYARVRSSSINLVDGEEYYLALWSSGGIAELRSARLIIL